MLLWHRFVFGLMFGCAALQQGVAQVSIPRDSLWLYARPPYHGVHSLSQNERDRIVRDTSSLRHLASTLKTRSAVISIVDTATVLWWLAESGLPEFVPLFSRFAYVDQPHRLFQAATYGLARNAELPQVSEQLEKLARLTSGYYAEDLAALMLQVNSADTRRILLAFPQERMSVGFRRVMDDVMRTPPLAKGQGRVCYSAERFERRSNGGPFRCAAVQLPARSNR